MSAHQFKAGDPVVCVDAEWHDPHPYAPRCPLVERRVYTVVKIGPATGLFRGRKDHVVIYVAEVMNDWEDAVDHGFAAARFRPVQKRQASIDVFRALLNPTEEQKAEIELVDFILAHAPMEKSVW